MSGFEIIELVEAETGLKVKTVEKRSSTAVLFARYVAIVMMYEEGYSESEIAQCFDLHRTSVYCAIRTINSLLITNKPFKTMYLNCIRRMAEMEEAA